jgi:spore germination protein
MYEIYDIKDGDTLESIAYMYDITVQDIKNINGDVSNFRAGGNLIVPKKRNAYFDTYSIKKGDSLYAISKEYGLSPNLLAGLNGLNLNDYIYPGDSIMVPKNGVSVYITAQGDTVDSVIRGMNANRDVFLKENDRIYLYPGQLIVYKEEK